MLILSVFFAGMASLAAEIAAARLLGNVFGTSNLVWANIIGLMLLYLTAGYYIGGRWADRSPNEKTYYQLLCWAAFTLGLIPAVARPILLFAAQGVAAFDAPVAGGSFLATLLLFLVPITLLGCVSPFAIRLSTSTVSGLGASAGRIYAISTLGSLIGTFLPVLVLIPSLGTNRTYLFFAFLLLLVALPGLWRADRKRALAYLWMPIILLILTAFAGGQLKPPPAGWQLKYETESAYNFIQVIEHGDTRYLLLNEGQGLHSYYNPDNLVTGGTWDFFLTAPFFNNPPFAPDQVESLALVGLAAGTISKQYTAVFGPLPIDGIEIDPAIVEAGRRYFDMNEPNLNVIVEDGRWGLAHSPRAYTVIGIDAYRLPYIPPQLTTVEFFTEARAHLTENGVLVINVGRAPRDRRLIEAMAATLHTVFPSVHVMDVPDTFNSIVVATVQPSSPANLAANLALLPADSHPLLRYALQRGVDSLRPTVYSETVFTDDVAPVEQLTNSIVINFLLGEGLAYLK
ncbi:MAG TPA: fused MFS/spermidine synthase [Anaerolineales bacterium]|nr:fused MFS/spermidine synthase [Anaerolineales bacterium]